jgi:DNA repair protein RecN (Recombination protein N)
MLLRLQIENLALIERAELEPGSGLNVLTGETGAGKTMLAQAIALLTGAQHTAGVVGPHGKEAYVEAEFDLPESLLAEAPAAVAELRPDGEETLVVARRITASGRSRALLWGRTCARDDLERLGELLLEISSQHEARRLARPATQLDLLDGAAGNAELRQAMSAAWGEVRDQRAALERARVDAADLERQRGDLEELASRFEEAAVEPGERAQLERERERLRHADELTSALAGAAELLNPDEGDGAVALTGRASELVAGVERFEPGLKDVCGELRDAALRLQEAAVELRGQLDGFEIEPGRLEQVEARLLLFAELERRFGERLDRLAERAVEARASLDALETGTGGVDELGRLLAEAEERAEACAMRLRRARQRAAPRFARAVEAELADLGMDEAKLEVRLERAETGIRGADRVTLLLAANPGLASAPLADVASGGELSRIALAVRVAARSGGSPGTLLLDEVDAGVGGRTARAVGEKLRRLAQDAQLICITHLPQIASLAERHFRVEKSPGDPTITAVSRLADAEVVDEIARMLGGEDGDEAARRHAAAMLAGV